jgi:hypothetical protein
MLLTGSGDEFCGLLSALFQAVATCGMGGLHAPCSCPPTHTHTHTQPTPTSNLWGRGDIKYSTLSGNTITVKGKEPCCSFSSAVCWPRLAPEDRYAHMASWVTPSGKHSCMATQAATRKGQECILASQLDT